jgi:hypothetical protein
LTQIRVGIAAPTSTGSSRRPSGSLEWRPTKRRTDNGDVVLPAPFTVGVGSDTPPVIEVAPTEPGWAWEVVERVQGGSPRQRVLAVPDSATVVDYADLVALDPATLDPAEEPEAAWWGALNIAAFGQNLIGTDDDGTPYYDPAGVPNPVVLGVDNDGVTYFVPPPQNVTTDSDGVPVVAA